MCIAINMADPVYICFYSFIILSINKTIKRRFRKTLYGSSPILPPAVTSVNVHVWTTPCSKPASSNSTVQLLAYSYSTVQLPASSYSTVQLPASSYSTVQFRAVVVLVIVLTVCSIPTESSSFVTGQ